MGRRFVVAIVALLAMLVLPGVASAKVNITKLVSHPIAAGGTCSTSPSAVDAPGGAHRDYCVALGFDTSTDDVRDLTIGLPAGVVGDPGATSSRCSLASFEAGACAAATQVGTVSSDVTIVPVPGLPGLQQTITGAVYNLTPGAGDPARLGISLDQGLAGGLSPVRLPVPIRVRVPDAGLDSVTKNVPNSSNGAAVHVRSMALTMWGGKNHHATLAKPFMTLPTRCDTPAATTVTLVSHANQSSTASTAFDVTDCGSVPFTPDLEVGPTTAPADTPGEAFAKLIVPTQDTGSGDGARRQAYLKDVALQLPAGLALNPPLANGLIPCTPEQFGQNEDRPPDCPPDTVMGTVEFRTPIFPGEVLGGKVYFGTPLPGKPLVNFISVEDPRLRVKLVGYATIDHATTAITAHFEDQPQVPFESFKFTYIDPGNGRATLTSPVGCGTYPVTAAMTPWGGGAPKAPTKTFDVVDCIAAAFSPTLGASVANTQAGGDAALSVHIERPDKNLRLQQLTVSLPPGLTGYLTAVPGCKVADARAANCPDASQVGTAGVAVGTGPAPLRLPGKVYLTEGFDGAIAGLAVIVDTKVPALDLGRVAVLQKIVLRPDTGIDVISESLPQQLEGIPTVYRTIDLTIDRKGFMRNATSCAPQIVHGAFSSVGGAMTAASDAPYQATGCENLPFAPKLTARVGSAGELAKGKHPPLQVTIQQAPGEAAMARTVVTLPENIGVDLKNLGGLCTDAQLAASACPANSKIGTVTADTPLLPTRLSGGVYLVTPDKPGLPGIALDLGLVRLKGSVEIKGRLTTTFASVPDVPLSRLVLDLTGGPKGSLTTTVDQCTKKPTFDAVFGSHSGVQKTAKIEAELVGCGSSAAAQSAGLKISGTLAGVAKKRPTLTLKATAAKALKELRITLPTTLKASSTKSLRKSGRLLMAGKRTKKATVSVTAGRLVFRTPKGKSSRSLQVTLPRGVLKQRKRIKAGQKVAFAIRVVGSDGKPLTAKVTLKAKK